MKILKNQSGQFVVESILIMVILLGITMTIAAAFKQQNLLAGIIKAPWQNMAGMIQNGTWAPPAASMALHPSQHNRHRSLRGEEDGGL